jgi:hypothetical protein
VAHPALAGSIVMAASPKNPPPRRRGMVGAQLLALDLPTIRAGA